MAGASGYLGRHLVRELKERGHHVRVLVRSQAQARDLAEDSHEQFVGLITDPQSLDGLCRDVDWVFTTVGITRQKDGFTYRDVDYQGNLNLLDQAETCGVRRFFYVSVLHGPDLRRLRMVDAKEAFVDALRTRNIPSCVVRPTGFFSDLDELLNMAAKDKILLFGRGHHRANPIHGRDLAKACVDQMEQGVPEQEVGGPEVLTHREMAQAAFKALHKPARIGSVPAWIAPPLRWLVRLLSPKSVSGPLEFFLTVMTRDMVAPTYGTRTLAEHYRHRAERMKTT